MPGRIYELLILGAGPAGITASIYAARKAMDFLTISLDIGGQAAWSGDIENYTGYQFLSGPELVLKFQDHLQAFGIQLNMPEKIISISKQGSYIKVVTDKNSYQAKSIIIATGKRPKELNIEGEKEFKNKGLTYCATCDGPLFKGKEVAVIGGGNSALDAALQMAKISPKVYVINIADELTGDKIMIEKLEQALNVEIWNKTKIKKVYGDKFVSGIEVEKEGKLYNLEVKGVFVEIGLMPNSEFAQLLGLNQAKEIIVDCYNRTSVEGIFAAGDVTNVPEKQIIIACGEGAKALLSAYHYLASHKFE